MEMSKDRVFSPITVVNRSVSIGQMPTPLVHSCSVSTLASRTTTFSESENRCSAGSFSPKYLPSIKKTSLVTETYDHSLLNSSNKFWNSRSSDSRLNMIHSDKKENLGYDSTLKELSCSDNEFSFKEKLGLLPKRYDLDAGLKDKMNRWTVNNVRSEYSLNSTCIDSLANDGKCFQSGSKRFGIRMDVDFISLPEDISDGRNYEIPSIPQSEICRHTSSKTNFKLVDAKTKVSLYTPLCTGVDKRLNKVGDIKTTTRTPDIKFGKARVYSPAIDKHYKTEYNTGIEEEASAHAHNKQDIKTDKNDIADQKAVLRITDLNPKQHETLNDSKVFVSMEMENSKHSVHICKAKCRERLQIKQKCIESVIDCNPNSRVNSGPLTFRTDDKYDWKGCNDKTRTENLSTCKVHSSGGNKRIRKQKQHLGKAGTNLNLPLCQPRNSSPIATRDRRYMHSDIVGADSANENVIDENCVWIKRTKAECNLPFDGVDVSSGESNAVRFTESPTVLSHQPRIMMFLTLLGSLLNPVFAPAGIYFLIRSKKAWSQKKYHSAYRFSYQASGIAIIGIIVTITSLVLIMLTVGPRAYKEATEPSNILTTTSSENQEMADIRSAGERFLQTIMNNSISEDRNGKLTANSRNTRRTISPRRFNTKVRHSTHRFGNIYIGDLNNVMQQITQTDSPETTRAQHFSVFFNDGVSRRKTRVTFRNESMVVYFDPASNITKIVHIPAFLQ